MFVILRNPYKEPRFQLRGKVLTPLSKQASTQYILKQKLTQLNDLFKETVHLFRKF